MTQTAARCPDLETIAAYLDGRLSDRERARITAHLAECEECYALFRESAQTHLEDVDRVVSMRTWRERLPRPRVLWSSSAAVMATAAAVWLVVGAPERFSLRPSDRELQALVAAVGTNRTIEGRLVGGFAYGPLRSVTRAGEPSTPSVAPDVRIAAAQIEKTAAAQRTPKAVHTLGIAYLVTGEVGRAVPLLEEAAEGAKGDARVLSDLAAAYLARAERSNQPQDFARAVTMADRALKADPHLAEASFNRAYALERLSLADQARNAWLDYLKVDSSSEWAAEARSRIAALAGSPQSRSFEEERRTIALASAGTQNGAELRAIVNSAPAAAQSWLDAQLLIEWPKLVLEGHEVEARVLAARLQRVSDALQRGHDDAFWRDAVGAVIQATANGHAGVLAAAHRDYNRAADAYDADRVAEATNLAGPTVAPLDAAGSPYALAARRYEAIGAFYANDFAAALDQIGRVAAIATSRHYIRLVGLSHRLEGLIHVVRGDFARGLDAYQSALACFQSIQDTESEAAIQTSLAEDFEFVGDTQRSWLARYSALALISSVRDPLAAYRILQGTSLAAVRQDFPEFALHLQEAALQTAQRTGRVPAVITGYLNRAAINKRLGRPEQAAGDLDAARRSLATVRDPLFVGRTEARVLLAHGEMLSSDRPDEAIADLDKALEHFQRAGTTWTLASAYLARGRANRVKHDDGGAEADFLAGIRVFEQLRSGLASEALRTSYFEQPWDLYTEMIRLQADRRDSANALMFAERARARTLLDAVTDHADTTPTLAEVRAALRPGVAVVFYAALDDRLLIWLLTRDSELFVPTATRQTDLARLVDRWRSESGADRRIAILRELYDLLIRPVDHHLPDGAALVVVPDGVLHAIPFAALIKRESGRYLIEHHAVATTPSLTIFVRSIPPPASASPSFTSALVVGNARGEGPDLPQLPDAEREARDIATLYPTRLLLVDDDASKPRFTAAVGQYEVVHFAGHAVSNDEYPALSHLRLAGPDESRRSLFAREIAAMRFARTDLVVLAACRTSAGRIRRGEGVLSLARPFLAAGVPTVVASLWDVDDRASHALFVRFHRALRRGSSIADALRDAQLAALGESDAVLRDPENWATFVVIGGVSALRARPPAAEN
jgi:CHAT domain-containing protein